MALQGKTSWRKLRYRGTSAKTTLLETTLLRSPDLGLQDCRSTTCNLPQQVADCIPIFQIPKADSLIALHGSRSSVLIFCTFVRKIGGPGYSLGPLGQLRKAGGERERERERAKTNSSKDCRATGHRSTSLSMTPTCFFAGREACTSMKIISFVILPFFLRLYHCFCCPNWTFEHSPFKTSCGQDI